MKRQSTGFTVRGECEGDTALGVVGSANYLCMCLLDAGQVAGVGGDSIAEGVLVQFHAVCRGCSDGQGTWAGSAQLGQEPPQGEQDDDGQGSDDRWPPPALVVPAGAVGGAEQDGVRGGQGPAVGWCQVPATVEVKTGGEDEEAACEEDHPSQGQQRPLDHPAPSRRCATARWNVPAIPPAGTSSPQRHDCRSPHTTPRHVEAALRHRRGATIARAVHTLIPTTITATAGPLRRNTPRRCARARRRCLRL